MATDIGKLSLAISASTGDLKGNLAQGESLIGKFADGVKDKLGGLGSSLLSGKLGKGLIAGFLGEGALALVEKHLGRMKELRKASLLLGADAGTVSTLKFASGDDFDALTHGITKYREKLMEAVLGNKEAKDSFAQFGLKVEELSKLTLAETIDTLAGKLKSLSNPADRVYFMFKTFGKAGPELIPVFEKLSQGMAVTAEEARRLGQYFTDAEVAAATAAGKGMKQYQQRIDALKESLGQYLVPVVGEAAKAINTGFDEINAAGLMARHELGDLFLRGKGLGGFQREMNRRAEAESLAEKAARKKAQADNEARQAAELKIELEQRYAAVLKQTADSIDAYKETWTELLALLQQGKIAQAEFDRLVQVFQGQSLKGLGLEPALGPWEQLAERIKAIRRAEQGGLFQGGQAGDAVALRLAAHKKLIEDLGLAIEKTPVEKWQAAVASIEKLKAGNFTARVPEMLAKVNQDLVDASGFREAKSPYDAWVEQMGKLNALFQLGAIGEEKLALMAGRLTDEMLAQQKIAEQGKPPEALLRGSAAEFSAVNAFRRSSPGHSLEERIAAAQREAAKALQKQAETGRDALKELKDINRKAGPIKVLGL